MRHVLFLLFVALVLPVSAQEKEQEKPKPKDTGLTGVLDEASFAALHELTGEKAPKAKGEMVKLLDGAAYLSLPKGEGPHPAVIVIHEWWGLNEHVKHWTDRLAADGYAALAVDLYEGKVATTRDEAMAAMRSVKEERGVAIIKAAFGFLKKDLRVKAPRVASIGWCFGGGWSLTTALTLPELDAAVIYYGRLVQDPDQLKTIKAELLGVFGNMDQGIPPKVVNEFDVALTKAGVTHKILRYDANHAFANPSSGRYDKVSAMAAWTEVRAFLKRKLTPARPPVK